MVLGKIVTLTCLLSGGFPPVSHVNISCAGSVGESVRVEGTSASLVLNITEDYNNSVCTCRAEHITGCYDLTSEYKLYVVEKNQVPAQPNSDSESDSDGMSLAVYVIIAAVVTVIVITVIVLIVLRRKGWRLGLCLYRKDLNSASHTKPSPEQQEQEQEQQQEQKQQEQEQQEQEQQQQQQQRPHQQQQEQRQQTPLPPRSRTNVYDTASENPYEDLPNRDVHNKEDLALSDLGQPIVTTPTRHEVPHHGETRDDAPRDALSRHGEPRGALSRDEEPRGALSRDGESCGALSRDGEPRGALSHDVEPRREMSHDEEPLDGVSRNGEPLDGVSRNGEPHDGVSYLKPTPQSPQLQQKGPTYIEIPYFHRDAIEDVTYEHEFTESKTNHEK